MKVTKSEENVNSDQSQLNSNTEMIFLGEKHLRE